MKFKKILHVINSMDPKTGGVCEAVRLMINILEKTGISNEVITMDLPNSTYFKQYNFPIHAMGPRISPWAYCFKLQEWFNHNLNCYHIIILHGLWLYPNYALFKALDIHKNKKFKAKPIVYIMPHGMLDPYFQNAEGRKLKSIRNWIYWKLIEGAIVNSADGILFTCEEEILLAKKTFSPYKPKDEINVGLSVIAPPIFSKEIIEKFISICPQLKNKSYFLFLSRIHEKKGVDLLIKCYSKIWKRYHLNKKSSKPPLLVIAGPGIESEYGKSIKEFAENHIPKDTVFFPGMLNGNEKWGAFYGCEAFILPSHQENFGIAVVEALACGKPVLISNQINIWREIQKNKAGIIANDNMEGTYNLIENWANLTDQEKRIMGIKAKSCFKNNFSLSVNSEKLYKVLQSQFINNYL